MKAKLVNPVREFRSLTPFRDLSLTGLTAYADGGFSAKGGFASGEIPPSASIGDDRSDNIRAAFSNGIKRKAVFITIEGLEGSGKSSVVDFLNKLLINRGFSVKLFREPGSTVIGEKIRQILLDNKNKEMSRYTELLLYLAARAQLIEEKLFEAFLNYDFVICDRFFDSTLAYQGVALGLGKIVEQAVKMFSLGVIPDLTIILDTPVKVGLARIKNKDRIESRSLTFHKKLRKGYLQLAKRYPKRIKVIDGRGSLEDVYKRVTEVFRRKLMTMGHRATPTMSRKYPENIEAGRDRSG